MDSLWFKSGVVFGIIGLALLLLFFYAKRSSNESGVLLMISVPAFIPFFLIYQWLLGLLGEKYSYNFVFGQQGANMNASADITLQVISGIIVVALYFIVGAILGFVFQYILSRFRH